MDGGAPAGVVERLDVVVAAKFTDLPWLLLLVFLEEGWWRSGVDGGKAGGEEGGGGGLVPKLKLKRLLFDIFAELL